MERRNTFEPRLCSKGGCLTPSAEACGHCGFDEREQARRRTLLRRNGFARREDGVCYLRLTSHLEDKKIPGGQ